MIALGLTIGVVAWAFGEDDDSGKDEGSGKQKVHVAIAAPAAGALYAAPAAVHLVALASSRQKSHPIAKVEFFAGAARIGAAAGPSATGEYAFDWTGVAAGAYVLTAKATNDKRDSEISAPVSIVVDAPPSVSLSAPAANAVFNAPAAVTLSANASDADGTVSKVEFFQGATPIGTALGAPYTVSWSGAAPGVYSLTAKATDNLGFSTTSAPVSVILNAPPTVSVASPRADAKFNAPASIPLRAMATDADGSIVRVDFYQGQVLIGSASAEPFEIDWTNVAAGKYSVTAVATDDRGATSTSGAVALSVNAPPSVSITAPVDGAVYLAPGTVAIAASASDPDGTIAKVEFFQGGTLIGTATGAPYVATLSGLGSGTYPITAVATDDAGASTTSSAVTVRINAAPAVSLTSPANGAKFTAPANITIEASAADLDGSIARVQFFRGETLITTLTAAPYSFTLTGVPQGSYVLTAVITDDLGAVTTSDAVSIAVNSGVAQVYYIYADHLNTPRLIEDQTRKIVWRWDQMEPFGDSVPDGDPNRDGMIFVFPLRFRGQYFDDGTGVVYNMFRDYHPVLGRYIESDPIGLRGGLNTYNYVEGKPLQFADPFGLDRTIWRPGPGRNVADGPRNGNWCGGNWSGGLAPSANHGKDGTAPPQDSLDDCCMAHDQCYEKCEQLPKQLQKACMIACDRDLLDCLGKLDDDCTKWPRPPRAGTEGDSQTYRDDATRLFTEEVKKWERQSVQTR
ncbi:MAG TPA: Ig-like domain-containing protein [Burkholderiales bacterium]|nr:Ig-like domain-containing protein [Burkholderiales bacterium]